MILVCAAGETTLQTSRASMSLPINSAHNMAIRSPLIKVEALLSTGSRADCVAIGISTGTESEEAERLGL